MDNIADFDILLSPVSLLLHLLVCLLPFGCLGSQAGDPIWVVEGCLHQVIVIEGCIVVGEDWFGREVRHCALD